VSSWLCLLHNYSTIISLEATRPLVKCGQFRLFPIAHKFNPKKSGFGGLGVSTLASRVRTRPKPSDFSGRKNPQRSFLQRGSKAIGPMSQICGMYEKTSLHLAWKSPFLSIITGHFSPTVPPFPTGSLSRRWRRGGASRCKCELPKQG
jgi:hypothetical protein